MSVSVLVVDDDEVVLNAIGSFLRNHKFDVLEASGGNEAFEILKSECKVDIVVSDIQMPNGNGIELLERITRGPHPLPVVLISGYSQTSAEEIRDIGAVAFLQKPFNPGELVDCLNQWTAAAK